MLNSFDPVSRFDARILILGSMPGTVSLQHQQYYAHPRNLFWPFMAELFAINADLEYSKRLNQLLEHQIALWDVLQQCRRSGSLDSNIESNSVIPNDFVGFFKNHPDIRRVFFNGQKAEQVFMRQVYPHSETFYRQFQFTRLPSTSPANASISRDNKFQKWQQLLQ